MWISHLLGQNVSQLRNITCLSKRSQTATKLPSNCHQTATKNWQFGGSLVAVWWQFG
jgi:hypothetical protein